ncbi:hypothetical protein Phum_PHUM165160 [Pediculus humanus corporis]|uniref:Uncharacterized protein n=1 Tax=Pediculus humanus subsp. corporis TaxID=121224 RepID=E0VFR8_PEDHC|nr:uncharacterized protein Phum_PHUM165160 [Pediculus humanus corporis]EEB12224.1 hypothetical protein Phum_PHUM165160 [Pediculus humanus corporis]
MKTTTSTQDSSIFERNGIIMLRRKSLSLDKSPVNRSEKSERRSSVAAGVFGGYKEKSPVQFGQSDKGQGNVEKLSKSERRGSVSGGSPDVKERRGSIVQRVEN